RRVKPSYILREQRGLALGSVEGNYVEYNFRCALDYVHRLYFYKLYFGSCDSIENEKRTGYDGDH
ncbi:MAG: hypothetical protein RL736_1, partial [Pseudomonadota bacterium]